VKSVDVAIFIESYCDSSKLATTTKKKHLSQDINEQNWLIVHIFSSQNKYGSLYKQLILLKHIEKLALEG